MPVCQFGAYWSDTLRSTSRERLVSSKIEVAESEFLNREVRFLSTKLGIVSPDKETLCKEYLMGHLYSFKYLRASQTLRRHYEY